MLYVPAWTRFLLHRGGSVTVSRQRRRSCGPASAVRPPAVPACPSSPSRVPSTGVGWVSVLYSLLPSAWLVLDHFALRPQKRGGLLGTGTGGGRGRESEGSTVDTARKGPERPWTAARTMEVLRRCPLAIAQRLVHCAIAVSTAVLGRVTG